MLFFSLSWLPWKDRDGARVSGWYSTCIAAVAACVCQCAPVSPGTYLVDEHTAFPRLPKLAVEADLCLFSSHAYRKHVNVACTTRKTNRKSPFNACVLDDVCLCQDFALGDFDDTPIAKMEQDKEAASQAEGTESDAKGGVAQQEGGMEGESGVGGLVRVVPQTEVDVSAPRDKPRKPLIEEL